MRRVCALATALLALGGCGEARTGSDGASQPHSAVPSFVRAMVDADAPTTGEIHQQSRGAFTIDSSTIFCAHPADISAELARLGVAAGGLDGGQLREALRQMGQPDHLNGSARTATVSDPSCADKNQVHLRWTMAANRQSAPYKLVLAVWQNGSAWVGQIERTGGVYPLFSDAKWIGESEIVTRSVAHDARAISESFFTHLRRSRSDK